MSAAEKSAIQANIDTRRFTCTLGDSATQTAWTNRQTFTWRELTAMLTTHVVGSKEGICVVPAVFRGTKRSKENADQIEIVFLDSDTGATLAEITAAVRVQGWAAVIASTHSHLIKQTKVKKNHWDRFFAEKPEADAADFLMQEKHYLPQVAEAAEPIETTADDYVIIQHQPCPKFRVAIPVARPWRASDYISQAVANAVWREWVEAVAGALNLNHDQSCTDTSRLYYLPRVPLNSPSPETAIIEGDACDIFSLADRAPADGLSATKAAQRMHPRQQTSGTLTFTDPIKGEMTDLVAWAGKYASRFLIAKALQARTPGILTAHVSERKVHIDCPNNDSHTNSSRDNATFVTNASSERGFAIHCRHGHCANHDRLAFLSQMLDLGWLLVGDLTDPQFLLPLAGEVGWETPQEVDEADGAALRELLAIENWAERDIPEPDRLLGDLLTTTTRMFLVGRTGLGKTLLGLAISAGVASGKGFLHWPISRPARVLYLDGEMPTELIQPRAVDAMRRLGGATISAGNLLIFGRDIEDEARRICPSLPPFAPLNTDEGRLFMVALLAAIGHVDLVIFDNVMSLITGDQKEEVPWSDTLPLVNMLTTRRIGQLWLDHTGHNTDRQYGSSTKAWRFDAVGVMTPLTNETTDSSVTGFNLSFDPPGKARRRTPNNWRDFEAQTIRLANDRWASEPVRPQNKQQQKTRLGPLAIAHYKALTDALVVSPTPGWTTRDAWYAECIRHGIVDPITGPGERDKKMKIFRARLRDLKVAGWIGVDGERITALKIGSR